MPERDDETRGSRRARRREQIRGNASHRRAGSSPRRRGGLVLFAGALVLLMWAIDYRAPSDYAARAPAAVRRRQALPLAASIHSPAGPCVAPSLTRSPMRHSSGC